MNISHGESNDAGQIADEHGVRTSGTLEDGVDQEEGTRPAGGPDAVQPEDAENKLCFESRSVEPGTVDLVLTGVLDIELRPLRREGRMGDPAAERWYHRALCIKTKGLTYQIFVFGRFENAVKVRAISDTLI